MVSCARTVAGLTLACMWWNPFRMALRSTLRGFELSPGVIAQGLAVDGLDLISDVPGLGRTAVVALALFTTWLESGREGHPTTLEFVVINRVHISIVTNE